MEPSITSPAKEPLVYPGDYTESLTALAAESHLTESDYLRIKVRRNFIWEDVKIKIASNRNK